MDNSLPGLVFPSVANREIVAHFDGGELTSDAGLLLVVQADRKLGLTKAMAQVAIDRRQSGKVRHGFEEVLSERIYAIACGYEDANDLDRLKDDPALKVACGRRPHSHPALASQPTISRLENSVASKDLLRMALVLAERVIAQLPADTTEVVLDVDATDDPCHGQQEFEFFNGYYDNHCYLPLILHLTGPDGRQRLLATLLRPGKASYRDGLFGMLRRAVRLLRRRFPQVRIILRADAGFGYADTLAFCESENLSYALGLQYNAALARLSTSVQIDTCLKYRWAGDGCFEYGEFEYRAKTWPHLRRVIVKSELTQGKLNTRYVVTNLDEDPKEVYQYYCQRGDRENRIKELKLDISSGRTSCHRFVANQLRLLMHTAACVLLYTLQEAASGTPWGTAQAGTFRLRLLKVAARVVESSRKIWFHLAGSYVDKRSWVHLNRSLCESSS